MKSVAVIYDDHRLFNDSFSALLDKLGIFRAVYAFSEDFEMREYLLNNNKTDIILFLDYYLQNGKVALSTINEVRMISKKTKIIILTSAIDPFIIKTILTYKPAGFISKGSGLDVVLDGIATVESGNIFICPIIQNILVKNMASDKVPFTAKEMDILMFFAKGLSIAETAEKTFLSKHTIISYRRNMMKKVGCNSITQLLAYARETSLI